jgi:2-iminobutanoate/2-iminopropanoate deaminase
MTPDLRPRGGFTAWSPPRRERQDPWAKSRKLVLRITQRVLKDSGVTRSQTCLLVTHPSSNTMRTVIFSDHAPPAVGPYSQAIKANGFIFCSGQLPIDPATGSFVPGGVAEQTEQVISNLRAVLGAAGSELAKIVKATVFLKDMNDFAAMNQVYSRHFPTGAPARSTIEVARLPKDALVEIEVIALAE